MLTPSERKQFESVIKFKKRKQLVRLYRILLKEIKQSTFSHKRIFEQLYEANYDQQKNYLLRNELRLLSQALQSFFARQQIARQFKKKSNAPTLFYLQEIAEKADAEFFLAECQRAADHCVEQGDFFTASKIMELYTQTFIQQTTPTYERYLQLLEKIEVTENLAAHAFLQQYIHIKKHKSFTLKSLNAMHPKKRSADLPASVNFKWMDKKWQTPYLKYQWHWAKSYSAEGAVKIQLMEAAAALIPTIPNLDFPKESELAKVHASIALDYFLTGDYSRSLSHHEKMLAQKNHLPDKNFAVYLFNYISTLLRVEDYSSALQLISKNEKLLLNQERLHDRFLNIKAMCHLLLNQIEQAESCIPRDRKEGGMYNYFYFRVVEAMVFYERSEIDLSLNELTNLQHSLSYNQLKDSGFKDLTKYLQRFLKLQRDRSFISNFKKEKQKLLKEIQSMDDHRAKFQYLLPYQWLTKKLSEK